MKKRYSPEQNRPQATPGGREASLGCLAAPKVARELGVSEVTYYRRTRFVVVESQRDMLMTDSTVLCTEVTPAVW